MTDVNAPQRYSPHKVSTIPKSKYFTAPYLPTAGVLRDTDIKRHRPAISVKEIAGRQTIGGIEVEAELTACLRSLLRERSS